MSHHHTHDHSPNNSAKNISVAFFLNSFFVVVELIGGLYTNSIAILSDAVHDLGDCISLAIAWILQKRSDKSRDRNYSYGYKRYSLLGSVFLSGVLTVSSLFIIYEAVKRVLSPQPVDSTGMLWIAIVGILVNGAAALRLKKGHSLNEKAVFLHIMEDVLGWVAVLVVSIVMNFIELPILDPLLSIGISIWVLTNVYGNLKATFQIFLQRVPEGIDAQQLEQQLLALSEVDSLHDIHIWTLDGNSHVMSLHAVSSRKDNHLLKEEIRAIAHTFGIDHVTLECETPEEICSDRCD